MRRVKNAKALGVLIFLTVAYTTAFGQVPTPSKPATQGVSSKPVPTSPKERAEPVVAKAAEPTFKKFSLAALQGNQLDLSATGLSLETLIGAVKKAVDQPKRGEFEPVADYEARKVAARSASFPEGVTLKDTFAVSMPILKWAHDKFAYAFSPDTGSGALFFLPADSTGGTKGIFGSPQYGDKSGLDFFPAISRATISRSTYQGSNAYGATTTVEKSVDASYGIAATRIPFLTFKRVGYYGSELSPNSKTVAVRFKMDSATAAKVIPALRALIVFTVSEPFTLEDAIYAEPTLNKPTDFFTSLIYLRANVVGIVWYSSATGEIFARLPERFGKPAVAPVQGAGTTNTPASGKRPQGN